MSTFFSPQSSLLTQYQVCQDAANNETSGYWAFAGILLGLSTVLLGAIIPLLFSPHGATLRIIILFLTLGMWLIYLMLFLILRRANRQQENIFSVMQTIESNLGMPHLPHHARGIPGWVFYAAMLIVLGLLWLMVLIVALL